MALQAEGHPVYPGSTGENLTVSGLDWDKIVPGTRLHLGEEILIEVKSFASPCGKIGKSFANEDFNRNSQDHNPGWARVLAKVLTPGALTIGATVSHAEAEPGNG